MESLMDDFGTSHISLLTPWSLIRRYSVHIRLEHGDMWTQTYREIVRLHRWISIDCSWSTDLAASVYKCPDHWLARIGHSNLDQPAALLEGDTI